VYPRVYAGKLGMNVVNFVNPKTHKNPNNPIVLLHTYLTNKGKNMET
jgi:hypothetical protein